MISCCALLQPCVRQHGTSRRRHHGTRGHAAIQGSTDVPTLYHSIHGYMSHPSALKKHATLRDYLTTETPPTGYWANQPKFMVSYLKSMYGDAATLDNDWGYEWHPRSSATIPTSPPWRRWPMEGKGMFCVGQNPATLHRHGAARGDAEARVAGREGQLAHRDRDVLEERAGDHERRSERCGHPDRGLLLPCTQVGEYDGSFTNTQRMLQWHSKAADPPGDCRTDTWFYYQLGKRLKAKYAVHNPRDTGFRNLVWDYEPDPGAPPSPQTAGEPDVLKILREINGFQTADPSRHLTGFAQLKDDGSTTCASWIYCGVYPAPDRNLSARREPDAPGVPGAHLNWAWAWPANRRVLYNRARRRTRQASPGVNESDGSGGIRQHLTHLTPRAGRAAGQMARIRYA